MESTENLLTGKHFLRTPKKVQLKEKENNKGKEKIGLMTR